MNINHKYLKKVADEMLPAPKLKNPTEKTPIIVVGVGLWAPYSRGQ